ncbi:DUF6957 family protein [Aquipseudomonas alcaligenes]|uniref:DUF6957 family protein n=1 Tax=Aquipseudomonas alcaligenes TaxID=43263 RepID=UPI003748C3E1
MRLQDITGLLLDPGAPMPGSEMSDDEALEYARRHFSMATFCLVRDWVWIEFDAPEALKAALAQTRRQPSLIYAHTVIFDSDRRWDIGDFVRTSLLHEFSEGFRFKTLNSVYLLLGPGTRKLVPAEAVTSIY